MAVVAGDINRPDGLAFSPNETKLYIIEDGTTPQVFRVYDVVDNGTSLGEAKSSSPFGRPIQKTLFFPQSCFHPNAG